MMGEKTDKIHLEWIERGLAKPGKNAKGLAAHMRIGVTAVSRIRSSQRALKTAELAKIAEYIEEPAPSSVGAVDPLMMRNRFDQLDAKLDRIIADNDEVKARLAAIDTRITAIDQRLDSMQKQIDNVRARLGQGAEDRQSTP